MIKYLGSKRLLLPLLTEIVKRSSRRPSVIDLFSGTSRVGHALKAAGFRVLANDHNRYAATLARCYVAADLETHEAAAKSLVGEFNRLPGRAGYFTETYCVQSRYFQPKNGERIEAIREAIAAKDLEPTLEAVLLTSLMEAADRVDSTTGVQMAYLKQWAARANNDLCLRMPSLLPRASGGAGEAHELDALDAAETLEADVAYLDPPYNQHKYLGNYHVWETLCRWDSPEVYGVACKRLDCKTRGSDFNSRPRATAALAKLIETVRAEALVVSFSDEGYVGREEMVQMLAPRGRVHVVERPYRRYVGAQIGIYNPGGQKVGKISHLDNRELVFVAANRDIDLGDLTEVKRSEPLLFA